MLVFFLSCVARAVAPQGLTGYNPTLNSFHISWSPSSQEHLQGYRLMYWKTVNGITNQNTIILPLTPAWTIIGGLEYGTNYTVKMLAFKEANGKWSDPLYLQTGSKKDFFSETKPNISIIFSYSDRNI